MRLERPAKTPLGHFAVALMLALTALAAFRTAAALRAPYPIDPADGGMLSSAWHVSRGESIYNTPTEPPFIYNIHPPVMIYASALALKIVGPAVWGPRLVSAGFFLGTALLVFALVARHTGSARAGLVAGLLILVERHFLSRAVIAACDYPAVFFSMLGLYFWFGSRRVRWLAPIAFAVGYFAKQSATAAPVALLAALVISRSWRAAAGFVPGYITALAALFGVCYVAFGQPFFANTLFHGAVGGVEMRPALKEFAALVSIATPLACVPYLALCGRGLLERRFVPLYTLTGLVVATTSLRAGGSRAYSFDLVTASAIAFGCAWPAIEAVFFRPASLLRRRALSAALFVQAGLLALGTISAVNFTYDRIKLKGHWGTGRHAARRAAFENGGMVLSRHVGYDVGTAGFNFTTDAHRLGQLLQMGVVSREPILKAVENGAFSGVIIRTDGCPYGLFDEELEAAVRREYELVDVVEGEEYYTAPSTP